MAYLTYAEYQAISVNPVSEDDFNKLIVSTSFTLDGATNYFYHKVDLETDYPARKDAFKRALAITVDYYSFQGSSQQFEQSSYQSVNIGRTSMTLGSNEVARSPYGNLPIDVGAILGPTGLLYRGVATSCL